MSRDFWCNNMHMHSVHTIYYCTRCQTLIHCVLLMSASAQANCCNGHMQLMHDCCLYVLPVFSHETEQFASMSPVVALQNELYPNCKCWYCTKLPSRVQDGSASHASFEPVQCIPMPFTTVHHANTERNQPPCRHDLCTWCKCHICTAIAAPHPDST
jgi:hypothetical protein